MKKKNKWSTFILLLVFFIGLSVMLYPAISSYWNTKTQSEAIVDYEKMIENMKPEDYTKIFEEADNYNTQLRQLNYPLLEYDKIEGYLNILDVTGTGMIGYLSIDVIGLQIPVYHTTNDNVLSIAAGHLEGSSLPIGGNGTHSVFSAHRGLPTATLFTNLDHLEIGDTFEFSVLDRTLTYQVDQIKTVDPTDTADLHIEGNCDYVTLLTCTPYGINTHRLLVRGKRIETISEKTITIKSDAHRIDPLIITPIVAMPILLTLMIIVLLKPVKKDALEDDNG
ncbi:MAG: class C sortase [Acutalibacteraceae bacterium]|nr:class C sortase [Acutalibacteraceae bacterium]